MTLPLDSKLLLGVQTIHRRTEPAVGPWLPTIDELVQTVETVDRAGFDSLWVGGIFFVIRSHLNIARFNADADWNSRLSAPIAQSVVRDSLGTLTLGIPDSSRF